MSDSDSASAFVVGWGTLSLINAGLARCMMRSGLAWWVLSLLLGPIATLVLVVCGPRIEHVLVQRQHPEEP